jgi:maleylacetate reductase
VVRFNEPAAPQAIARAGRALGASDAAAGLFDLLAELGLPARLDALGLLAEDLPRAAGLATEQTYPNPRPVNRDDVLRILGDALVGRRP